MKARLVILVVVAMAMAVALAMRTSAPRRVGGGPQTVNLGDAATSVDNLREKQKMVWEFPLPGEDPEEESEFEVGIRVDTSSGKNRLVLEIAEIHGHYVEYLRVDVWYAGPEDLDLPDSPLVLQHTLNRYVPANETIEECFELVPRELQIAGAEIGVDEHWAAEIANYARSRVQNPAEFPPVGGESYCDD